MGNRERIASKRFILFIALGISMVIDLALFHGCKIDPKIVGTIRVKRGDIIDFVNTVGRLEAIEEVVTRAKVNARIEKVLVEEGSRVKVGDELVRYDITESEDAVKRAKLKLEQAQIAVKETEMKMQMSMRSYSDPAELESNLKAKESNYQQRIINRDSAEREFNIAKELYNLGAESFLNLKNKEDRLKRAEIELLQAKWELEETKELVAKREKTKINLSALRAEYESNLKKESLAKSELELAILQLDRLKCVSSLNGIVTMNEVKDEMAVRVGQPIMTIADISHLQVRAEVDELDAKKIKKKQKAVITFDAFPDKEFYGYVNKVAPQARIKGERTIVETVIILDEYTDLLKIANQVDVEIITGKKKNVLLLPLSFVYNENNHSFVWLYQNGSAERVEVDIGLSDMDSIEIINGLKEGDEVILTSGLELKDGERVEKVE